MKPHLKLNQTADPTEQLWHQRILLKFPAYGDLWSEFIGTRIDPDGSGLWPYDLSFRTRTGFQKDREKYERWRKVCLQHYQIFVALTGAMYHEQRFQEAWSAYGQGATGADGLLQNFFVFREEFDALYFKMQGALEFSEDFGAEALRWIGNIRPVPRQKILEYAEYKNEHGFKNNLEALAGVLKERIGNVRHFIAHQGRLPAVMARDGHYVPDILDEDGSLSEVLEGVFESGGWRPMHDKAPHDFKQVFEYVEIVDALILDRLRELVRYGEVRVDYDSGQTRDQIYAQVTEIYHHGLPSSAAEFPERLTGTNVQQMDHLLKKMPGSGDKVG